MLLICGIGRGLNGRFVDYLKELVSKLVQKIRIDNANARIRSFKTKFYICKWTTSRLVSSATVGFSPALPYFRNDICQYICEVPEHLLTGRQIQIEYLKMVAPQLARIPWQAHRPFNLYNYNIWNRMPWNLPYRVLDKSRRTIQSLLGKPLTQRNWELQFLGKDNLTMLDKHLLSKDLPKLVHKEIIVKYLQYFKNKSPVIYSHPLSMRLVLSKFAQFNLK